MDLILMKIKKKQNLKKIYFRNFILCCFLFVFLRSSGCLELLPPEIKDKIMSDLLLKDQYNVGLTSHDFYFLYDDLIEKNQTYREERYFKRFSTYIALNQYY